MRKSFFGVIGLGVMGKSLALNIVEKDFSLSVYNRKEEGENKIVDNFIHENENFKNLKGFSDLPRFVASLERPRKMLLMIKAGKTIDLVIEQLIPLLDANDIIIDGGNSHYLDTKKRGDFLAEKGIQFIGCGISGGEEGARKGPSIMPGGSLSSYNEVAPVLEAIAAKNSFDNPCCVYVGPDGAGHFVKMVHNGMEYAEMQLLTEVFSLLSLSMNYDEIAELLAEWNQGDLSSYLLGITVEILQKKEGDAYLLDLILDKAGNKGTGSWSSKAAFDLGVASTMMSSAVFARYISAFKEKRIQLSERLSKNGQTKIKLDVSALKNAYRFARVINHHQGFDLMQQASDTYNWDLKICQIARIWTEGCIIKSKLMGTSIRILRDLGELLEDKNMFYALTSSENDVISVIQNGLDNRVSIPCFYASYDYWIAMTTKSLPANLIQAQRDFFGAHTYQRKDRAEDQFFHTNWASS